MDLLLAAIHLVEDIVFGIILLGIGAFILLYLWTTSTWGKGH